MANRPGTLWEENRIRLQVDGVSHTYTPEPFATLPHQQHFVEMSYDFVAMDSTVDIKFSDVGENSNGYGSYLDDVRLTLKYPEVPSITINDAPSISESVGTHNFTVQLSHPYDLPITVNYALTSLTATLGEDFNRSPATGTLTIPAHTASVPLAVEIINDNLYEGAAVEQFKVTLSGATNATISDNEAVGTIVDNESQPMILVSSPSLIEGNSGTSYLSFVVSLLNPSIQPVSVQYATANDTATAGSDYTTTTGTLNFLALSSTPQTVLVPIIGDTSQEDNETFLLNLSNFVNANTTASSGTGTILDDDSPIVSISGPTPVTEGDLGTVDATFTITLDRVPTRNVTVAYTTLPNTATQGSDYQAKSGTLTFLAGTTSLSQTVDVYVNGDIIDEDDQSFSLVISSPVHARIVSDPSAIALILDDDDAPTVSIIDAAPVLEGHADTTVPASFTIVLSAPSEKTIHVPFETEDGTAKEPVDYAQFGGVVTFTPGEVSRPLTVTINGDNAFEPDEVFYVNLQSPFNATLSDSQAIGTILNDEPTPRITIDGGGAFEGDIGEDRFVRFVVTLTGTIEEAVAVHFTTALADPAPDAATQDDFVALAGTLLIGGSYGNTYFIDINLIGDKKNEYDELFFVYLTLDDPSSGIEIETAPASGTIENDDGSKYKYGDRDPCDCSCSCSQPKPDTNEGNAAFPAGATEAGTNENPHPIVTVKMTLPADQAVPDMLKAQLTFGGVVMPPVYYATTGLIAGQDINIRLQADATTLPTGHYDYQVVITSTRGAEETIQTSDGATEIFNRIDSPYGNRRWVKQLDHLVIGTGGVTLVRSDSSAAWFVEDGNGGYYTPPKSFSTLVKNLDGSYTQTFADNRRDEYGVDGLLNQRIDRLGNATHYSYLPDGRISTVTDPYGRVTTYAYDSNDHLSTVTDFAGRVTLYNIDAAGFVQSISEPDPDGTGTQTATVTSFSYDANGLPIEVTVGDKVTKVEYDFARRVSKIVYADDSDWEMTPTQVRGLVNLSTIGYDETHPAPATYLTQSDQAVTHDQAGQTASITHDAFGQVAKIIDESGVTTIYDRDDRGNVTQVVQVNPSNPSEPLVTSFVYNAKGKVTGIVHADGSTESWVYDTVYQRPISYTDQLGRTTIYTIDPANGNLLAQRQVMNALDGAGNSETDDLVSEMTYTGSAGPLPEGLPLTSIDPNGNVTKYVYFDSLSDYRFGWLQSLTRGFGTADAATVTYDYDLAGNVNVMTDELGRRTDYLYDARDRLVTMTGSDPDGAGPSARPVTSYTYDDHDNLLTITDPLGQVTVNEYDSLDRLVRQSIVATASVAAPVSGLVGSWSFNEASGTVADDNSASGNDGTLHGGATRIAGRTSGGLDLNGTNGYVAVGQPAALNITGQITISAWIKPDSSTGVQNIVARGYAQSPNGEVFLRIANGSYEAGSWNGSEHKAGAAIPSGDLGTWVHLTGVYDGTTWKLYRNGELLASKTDAIGAVAVNGNWAIGARGTGTERFFNGAVDEVQIYNRGLSPSEVSDLAQGVLWSASYTYDVMSRLTSSTDSLGRVTNYGYDVLGRPTSQTQPDPDGTGPLTTPHWQSQYDAIGRLIKTIDPLGLPTVLSYDAMGRVLTQTTGDDAAAPSLGLAGYWAMNESSGNTAADSSGNAYTGNLVGGVSHIAGPSGQALHFDGVDDYVALGNPSALAITGQITISAWIRPEATTGLRNIVAKGHATSPNGEIFFRINNDSYQIGTWNGTNHLTTATIPSGDLNQWVHLTGVYDGTAWKLYRNGELLASTDSAQGAVNVNGNWAIGARGTGTERFFKGDIDEVRIYSRGLSAAEVALINAPAEPGVVVTNRYAYDAAGQLLSTTDPLGRVTTYEYDDAGRLVKVTQPDPDAAGPLASPVWLTAYDKNGNVISQTDPRGAVTLYAYDHLDRLITLTQADPDAAGPLASPVTHYTYDAAGQLLSIIDPLGRITSYTYDDLGRVTQLAQPDPDGAGVQTSPLWTFTYDLAGNLLTETDPRGNTTTYTYDSLYRVTTLTQPDPDGPGPQTSPLWTYAYDAEGNLQAETDPLGSVTRYEYDALNRTTKVTSPDPDDTGAQLAPWNVFTYDAVGNLLTQTNRLGHATTYTYDNLYRQKRVANANGEVTAYAHDLAGNLLSLTDPAHNVTFWAYDRLDRVTTETNSLGGTRSFTYDATGNLTQQTDRLGRVTQFTYDALHRLTTEHWQDGEATLRTLAFAYDAAGQLTSATDPAATYDYIYDQLGRTTSITGEIAGLTPDVVLSQAFDAASNRTRLTAAIGGVDDFINDYVYDGLDRLTRLTQQGALGGNVVAEKRFDLAYNAIGQRDLLTRYADLIGDEMVATSAYGYDLAHRLTGLTHAQGVTSLAGYDYTYDAAHRITSIDSFMDGLSEYAHDATDQLVGADHASATDESYSYDDNGNRTMAGYVIASNNRIISDGSYDYEYDVEGNMTAKETIATGEREEYAWDHRNRLVGVTFRDGANVITKVVEHEYDVFNRWVRRTVDGSDTFFVYDGNQVVLEFSGDTAADLSHRYVWSNVVDDLLAVEQVASLSAAGTVVYALNDHLGTPRDLVTYNTSTNIASIASHRFFDSFGNLVTESDSSVTILIGFTGRPSDTATGKQWNLNRWYVSSLGVWMSEDPIGFEAGDPNLKRYLRHLVLGAIDPSGLDALSLAHSLSSYLPGVGAGLGARTGAAIGGSDFVRDAVKARLKYWFEPIHTPIPRDSGITSFFYCPNYGKQAFLEGDPNHTTTRAEFYQEAKQTTVEAALVFAPGSGALKPVTSRSGARAVASAADDLGRAPSPLARRSVPKPTLRKIPPHVGNIVSSDRTTRLTSRANEIHSVLDPIARRQRVTAVIETDIGDIIGGGARDLSPAQRALQQQNEILSKLAGEHAEITALQEALNRGAKPRAIGTTRDFCEACRKALEESGATITSPRTAVWP